jgi:2-polyprenyl-6-methoxyphenol hydroxylase-like FAD-dependent oxidoreductase
MTEFSIAKRKPSPRVRETVRFRATGAQPRQRIAVIGAGPSGLTLARLLQMRGHHVTVFESVASPDVRLSGGSLDIDSSTGGRALRAAGLGTALARVARPEASGYTIADSSGAVLLRIPATPVLCQRPEVDRQDLRRLLLEALAPQTVRWGHRLAFVERDTSGRNRLRFEQRSDETADIVVGADGVHSGVRPYITSVPPRYSGVSLLQGELAEPERQCPEILRWMAGGNLFALGHGKGVLAQRRGDGVLVFYLTQKVPENRLHESAASKGQHESMASRALAGWHPAFTTLFSAAQVLVPHPLYVTPADQTWESQSDMTLMGDAAHSLTPFGGQGANMGLCDALSLADCLAGHGEGDTAAAIRSYEREMLTRTRAVQIDTLGLLEVFHSPDAGRQVIRRFLGPFAPLSGAMTRVATIVARVTRVNRMT